MIRIQFQNRSAIAAACLACLIWFPGDQNLSAAENESAVSAPETNSSSQTVTATNDLTRAEAEAALRAFLRLQELLHAERPADSPPRPESDTVATAAPDSLAPRLEAIERALHEQRGQDLEAMRSSNRTLLLVAVLFAGVSLLTMVCSSFLQWRAVNRLADAATTATGLPLLNAPGSNLPEAGPPLLGQTANSRWHGVVERLEQRVRELEHSADAESGNPRQLSAGDGVEVDADEVSSAWLGKAQALLNLGQNEEALKCFDAVLKTRPDHLETLLRKGAALERLKRLDAALELYERAAAKDPNITRAWLGQASVLNQQERFKEALDCYERALRGQTPAQRDGHA